MPGDTLVRAVRITFLGHATLRVELDGAVLLTDPVLRPRIPGLVHRQPVRDVEPAVAGTQTVLISHLHHDHLDVPSLRHLPATSEVLVPRNGAPLVRRAGLKNVVEVAVGDCREVGDVRVRVTPATHLGYRVPFGPAADSIGFLIEGSRRVYFAGDTDIFDAMAELAPVDVALLPVAGWGPRLGPGHMGPAEAVRAVNLLRPRIVVPIHWGTLVPMGMHLRSWSYLTQPPLDFAAQLRDAAPEVSVRILQPGETLQLDDSQLKEE